MRAIDADALIEALSAVDDAAVNKLRELIEKAPTLEFPVLSCEGIKMFRGTMRITPKNPKFPPKEIDADWLYKKYYDEEYQKWYETWYDGWNSYPAEICERIK